MEKHEIVSALFSKMDNNYKLLEKYTAYSERWSKNFKQLQWIKISRPPSFKDYILLRLTYREFYYKTKCEKLIKKMEEIQEELNQNQKLIKHYNEKRFHK